MSRQPSLLAELFRRHPVGPVLYLVGLVALGVLWFNFEPGVPTSGLVKVIGLVGIGALAVGMPLAASAGWSPSNVSTRTECGKTLMPTPSGLNSGVDSNTSHSIPR